MKPINELSADELRREIAERLGLEEIPGDMETLMVIWEKNTIISDWYVEEDDRLTRAGVPNWPRDVGAALALCKEIALMNHYHLRIWWVRDDFTIVQFDSADGLVMESEQLSAATDALALARLALAALRAQGGDDE